MKKYSKLSLISCLLLSITGCGQTGSLYLPEPATTTAQQETIKKTDVKTPTTAQQDK